MNAAGMFGENLRGGDPRGYSNPNRHMVNGGDYLGVEANRLLCRPQSVEFHTCQLRSQNPAWC